MTSRLPIPVVSALLGALAGALLLLAPAAAEAKRDRLTIGITQFPSSFHPLIDSMLAKSYILGMTRRSITAYDQSWKLVCMLCVKLPTIENGLAKKVDLPDGKTGMQLTVTLHPKATWGDGTPVTTKDVIFTWKVGKHPLSGVGNAESFRRILSVKARDDKTFVMTIDRVTFKYNDLSGFDLLPVHLEAAAFKDPREYRNRTLFDTDTTNPGLYFGPYKITKVVSGSYVVLEPNKSWYGRKPYFKQLVVRIITNTAAMEATLLAGGIDYIAGEAGIALDQALGIEARHKGRFNFLYKAGLFYEHLDVDLDNPFLADKRVRQALIYGLQRQKMVEVLFKGRQTVADSNVSPLDQVHAKNGVPTYRYDPKKARALLAEAGWKKQGRYLVNDKGERLRILLMTTAGNRSRALVQQIAQSYWRRLGIDVRIKNEPARVFFGVTVTKRRFEGLAMFAWISAPEAVPRSTLYSTMIPTAKNNWSGQNYTGYKNPRVDKLIDALEVELDPVKRMEMWRELQVIYATDLPAIPLFFRADSYIMPKWLKGIRPTGHLVPSTYWVEDWTATE